VKHAIFALCVLAIANVVALLAFAGWLKVSDRLNGARIEQVRQIFAPTIGQQNSRQEEEQTKAAADRKSAEQAARLARPSVTTEMELTARIETTELDRQRQQRLRDEIGQLQTTISAKLDELEKLKVQVSQARQEFEDVTRKTRALASDQQFKKSLGVLETMKPGQAKVALKEVMVAPDGKEKAVAYLNAMDEGVRSKVLQEFLKDEPKVAADLLEALRTSGVPPATPGAPAK
jgi:hypothetical protein